MLTRLIWVIYLTNLCTASDLQAGWPMTHLIMGNFTSKSTGRLWSSGSERTATSHTNKASYQDVQFALLMGQFIIYVSKLSIKLTWEITQIHCKWYTVLNPMMLHFISCCYTILKTWLLTLSRNIVNGVFPILNLIQLPRWQKIFKIKKTFLRLELLLIINQPS